MNSSALFLLTASSAVIAGMMHANAHAEVLQCETANITVHAPNDEDAIQSCRGANAAVRFLVAQGMAIPPVISINVVDKMPEGIPESALGVYSWAERQITLLTYSAFRVREKQVRKFRVPVNRDHYRAAAAHEVAHAVTHYNFKAEPSLLASEYIAYVTLFYTLPSAERNEILRDYPYDDDWEKCAAVLYMGDPIDFGTHAYRHFVRQKSGAAYIHRLLSGESSLLLPGE